MHLSERKFISHYAIFDYWKDKRITEDGNVETEIGYEGSDENKVNENNSVCVVEDWGEPECWACARPIKNYDYGFVDSHGLQEVYNHPAVRHSLEKCHIIPHALGGHETPDNMFLLCCVCHRNSPDTVFKKEFFRWIYKRKQRRGTDEVLNLIDTIDELKRRRIPPLILKRDIISEDTTATHGGMIVRSSVSASVMGAVEQRWEQISAFLDSIGCGYYVEFIRDVLIDSLGNTIQSTLSTRDDY